MASYAQDVKNELARHFDDDNDCLRAELLALLTVGTKKIDGRIEFSISNAAVARKVITLFKKFFPKIKPEVVTRRRKKLRKDLSYVVRIFLADEVQNFLAEVDSPEFLKRTRYKVAYLRGAFLATGTVNRPESQYFLEMSSRNAATATFIRNLLENLEFRAGFYQRKKFFVVWIREADLICDFLGMVGANDAVERFEIARNVKEIRKQVTCIVNLETAALNTAVDAAQRQIADIKILLNRKTRISDKIKEAVKIRLENPSCTIDELAEKLHITYNAMRHRFRKINKLAHMSGKK
ncbi:MAG: DNA-binding protein WhiA [Selenomonadaceae bacterium]|nr:DNA-binding protein WhiA [Selenomonadaceae bacterium]